MLRLFRGASRHTKTIWWVLIVVTVVTFLGGFVFLFGAGFDTTGNARRAGAVGVVDGHEITQQDYQAAFSEQSDNYRRQFGAEPSDRDLRMVELQAWRALIAQQLVSRVARREGLKAYDEEVKWSLKTSPPNVLTSNEAFQTNGKFDPNKFEAATRNPSVNWAPFEAIVRDQLPTRKLEQRLLASIKLSEPELHEEFRARFERINVTAVQIPPATDPGVPAPSAADLQRAYDENRSRFVSGARAQLEVLLVPRKYTDEDLRTAKQLAQSLVDRARRGEDFGQLAKDYSEGPAADKGGVIDRVVQSAEFGVMGQHMETLPPGGISDAFQDNGRFIIFKLLEKVPAAAGSPGGMKVAQIVVKAHPNDNAVRDQYDALVKLRTRARRIGLGKAAAEKGMATLKTRFYDQSSPPEELYTAPEASDWGLRAKAGEVSPVFDGLDEFVIAEVAARHEAGPASRDEVADVVRQFAEMALRTDKVRPRADSLAAMLAQGRTLEQAAQAMGLKPVATAGMTRYQPASTLAAAPDLVGALFAAPAGKVIGPVRGISGWFFGRVDQRVEPDSAAFEKNKGEISSDVLTRRQQSFFGAFVNDLVARAKVEDLRHEATR
ncbi:MAG TPA: SurA N-terminal domain-containing protein [Candidatus Eisenbacteria bacterium]